MSLTTLLLAAAALALMSGQADASDEPAKKKPVRDKLPDSDKDPPGHDPISYGPGKDDDNEQDEQAASPDDDDDGARAAANAAVDAATRENSPSVIVAPAPATKPAATKPKTPIKVAPAAKTTVAPVKTSSSAPKPAPKPATKPAATSTGPLPTGELASTVSILGAQKALNALGYKVIEDGLYGPITAKAWAEASKRYRPAEGYSNPNQTSARNAAHEPVFARVSSTQALTYEPTARAIATAASKALPAPTSLPPIPSGANALTSGVIGYQKALNRLGYKLIEDGLYGPQTAKAWTDASKRFPPLGARNAQHEGVFARVSPNTALTYKPTADAVAKAAQNVPAPGPSPVAHSSKPNPEGYDPAKARASARSVANNLSRARNQASVDTRLLQQWQRQAGLTPDGKYGGGTRGALLFYGVSPNEAPQPYVAPMSTVTFVPPEKR